MHAEQSILDNPVWHALVSGNKNMAYGTDKVKYFSEEVSPMVGLQEYTKAHFDELQYLIVPERTIVVFSIKNLVIPHSWNVVVRVPGFQMVYANAVLPVIEKEDNIISLTEAHIPQMLALTQVANPGPFAARTVDFGNYKGVLKERQLAAMAGQRFRPYDYTEISAVCTHPAHTGKGYARQLLVRQIHRIVAAGNIPFLHVKEDNSRAIRLYQQVGFKIRTPIYFFVLQAKA